MAFDLIFLRPADRRVVAIGLAAFALLGAGFGASALLHGGVGSPAPAPSPPAVVAAAPNQLTSDDIAGVRHDLHELGEKIEDARLESRANIAEVRERLSAVEGYLKGQREARK
jgi:hypothetical protein